MFHQVHTQLAFVEKGAFKSYITDEKGRQFILNFMKAGDFLGDYSSYTTQSPSKVFIESITDSRVLVSSENISSTLHQRHLKWFEAGANLTEKILLKQQIRLEQLLTLDAKARYHLFVKEFEEIVPLITQAEIASYLGVTATSLSRILREE